MQSYTYNTYFEDYFFDDAKDNIEYSKNKGEINLPDDFELPETSEEWLSFLEEYHLTEIYADVYQVAKLLTDYDNVKSINLDNISHDDAEYTKGTVQVEYDE